MRTLLPIAPVLRVVSASQSEELALQRSTPSCLRSTFNAFVNRPGPLPSVVPLLPWMRAVHKFDAVKWLNGP